MNSFSRLALLLPTSPALYLALGLQGLIFATLGIAEEPVHFDRDIRPILSEYCYTCHGPDGKQLKAGLRLDQRDSAFQKNESGAIAIVPRSPNESELLQRVRSKDEAHTMPPPESGKSLNERQIQLLQRWIEEGAEWTEHWAFRSLSRPNVPVSNLAPGMVSNPIDSFVLARLKDAGLTQSPRESKERLIRRVSLDLTGLPPTIAEVDAFLQDDSPEAFEKVVDRLLCSQHFGERLAMPWLDLARYGDTSGYHNDSLRDMWLWREWVIRAFNDNMPFDQFTREQLAGDLIPNATIQQQVASGFHRNVMTSDEGGLIDSEYRNLYVVDRVATTGVTWLGMTVACAQCHDHKYDPISQSDFYKLYAFFNNVPETGKDGVRDRNPKPFLKVPTQEQKAKLETLDSDMKMAEQRLKDLKESLVAKQASWEKDLNSGNATTTVPVADALFPLDSSGDGSTAQNEAIPAKQHGKPKFVEGMVGKSFESNAKTWFEYGDSFQFEKDQAFSVEAQLFVTSQGGSPFGKMDDKNGARGWDLEFHGLRPSVHLIHRWPENAIHIQADEDLVADTFTHVAFSYDGSGKAAGLRLYINGVLAKTSIKMDGLKDSILTTTPFSVGRRGNSSTPFVGRIDHLRIFRKELSDIEVAGLGSAEILKIAAVEAKDRTPKQKEQLERYFYQTNAPEFAIQQGELARIKKEREEFEKSIPDTMVMAEMEKPRDTFIKVRGNYDQDGERIEAAVPSFLPQIEKPTQGTLNRLHLADWLTSPQHPLTARVAINRWWTMLFGTGIVKTGNDFGSQGERPSHPELLDWLASDYLRDWDTKRVIKQIVMSATYQQTSMVTPALRDRDIENRLLARGPRQRLDAELLRDNALSIGGILYPAIGGKSIKPFQPEGTWEINEMSGYKYEKSQGQELYRRGLYVYWRRSTVYPSFITLDAPTREFCVSQRAKTSTPLQSLVLMNDPVFVEAARAFAERILSLPESDDAARLLFAWRSALARSPSPQERDVITRTLEQQRSHFRNDRPSAEKLASVGDLPKTSHDPSELAAWTALCNVLLNLNETLSN